MFKCLGGMALQGSEERGWDFFSSKAVLLLLVSPESLTLP